MIRAEPRFTFRLFPNQARGSRSRRVEARSRSGEWEAANCTIYFQEWQVDGSGIEIQREFPRSLTFPRAVFGASGRRRKSLRSGSGWPAVFDRCRQRQLTASERDRQLACADVATGRQSIRLKWLTSRIAPETRCQQHDVVPQVSSAAVLLRTVVPLPTCSARDENCCNHFVGIRCKLIGIGLARRRSVYHSPREYGRPLVPIPD
jgi:hypothetical protein